jgi:DnaD/phage-associated family protein
MTDRHPFPGFPGVGRATAIPNAFFAAILPQMHAPEDLLAFLWVARLTQEQKGEARFVTADQVWQNARETFEAMGDGRPGLERGLAACAELGALVALRVTGAACDQVVYFVNNPASRRSIARARAGELELAPETIATTVSTEARPGIFRLYEEQVGTITPLIGERLIEAQDTYSAEWIEEAFATAAAMNVRNWRYIERILQRWAEEGRANEAPGRDPFEEQKQRYLGGTLGNVVRYR